MAGRLSLFLAVLALAGCDLGDGPPERSIPTSGATTTVIAQIPTQRGPSRTGLVVQAIRSCEVKRIVFLHSDKIWITFRGGTTIHTTRLDTKEVERAAWKHADPCNILIGME